MGPAPAWTDWKTLSVYPAVNGYLALFKAEEGLGGEGKGLGIRPYQAEPCNSETLIPTDPNARQQVELRVTFTSTFKHF